MVGRHVAGEMSTAPRLRHARWEVGGWSRWQEVKEVEDAPRGCAHRRVTVNQREAWGRKAAEE